MMLYNLKDEWNPRYHDTSSVHQMPAPMALFFLNGEKQLIPIAIQLFQDIAPDNPVSQVATSFS